MDFTIFAPEFPFINMGYKIVKKSTTTNIFPAGHPMKMPLKIQTGNSTTRKLIKHSKKGSHLTFYEGKLNFPQI